MLRRSAWMALFFLILSVHPSFSQRTAAKKKRNTNTNKSLRLQRQKILAYALRHNRGLRAFRAQIKRAKAALRGARVFPNNPTLAAGGGPQLPVNSTVTSGQPSSILPRVGVDLSLALPVGGRWGKTQRLASSRLKWFQNQLQFQTFRLSLSVHRLLNRVAVASQLMQKRRAIASFFQRVEGFTRKRMKHGTATQLDLQLAQTSQLRARQALLSATLQYRLAHQRLKMLVGWASSKKMPWQAFPIPAFSSLPKKSVVLSTGLRKHILIRVAEANIRQAKATLALAKARAIPDLTISLGYSLEDNNHIVRGSISIPLPLFWRNQSQIGQNHARLRRARLLLARQRFLVRQRILQAYTRYRINLKMIRLFKKQFQTVQARSRLIEKGLRQGSFSVFQALTAQRGILQSQLLNLQNIQKAHDSYIQLCQAGGLLPAYKGFLRP